MKTAVVALTLKGRETAKKIKACIPEAKFFFNERIADGTEDQVIKESFSQQLGELFDSYTQIICICATGIVVRGIAPHIQHKSTDPAVVVIDDGGKFVIPLISGHLGGANKLAQVLADILNAQAVITTASDNLNILAAEMWGKDYALSVENFSALPTVNGALVNNEKVAVISDWQVPPEAQTLGNTTFITYFKEQKLIAGKYNAYIYVTDRNLNNALQPALILRPKTLVAGIGVRRGISKEVIKNVLQQALQKAGLSIKSLSCLASIDAKKDETGLLELAEDLKVTINFYNKDKLQNIISAKALNISTFVESKMGVGAVCEPAALAVVENSTLIMNKYQEQGVTVAIARVPFTW